MKKIKKNIYELPIKYVIKSLKIVCVCVPGCVKDIKNICVLIPKIISCSCIL